MSAIHLEGTGHIHTQPQAAVDIAGTGTVSSTNHIGTAIIGRGLVSKSEITLKGVAVVAESDARGLAGQATVSTLSGLQVSGEALVSVASTRAVMGCADVREQVPISVIGKGVVSERPEITLIGEADIQERGVTVAGEGEVSQKILNYIKDKWLILLTAINAIGRYLYIQEVKIEEVTLAWSEYDSVRHLEEAALPVLDRLPGDVHSHAYSHMVKAVSDTARDPKTRTHFVKLFLHPHLKRVWGENYAAGKNIFPYKNQGES